MVILQLAVLFLFLAIGELVVWLTDIPIPSSIIGMLLLTLSLQLKIIKLRHVAGVADFLVGNLGFFFVPAGVALLEYFANLVLPHSRDIRGLCSSPARLPAHRTDTAQPHFGFDTCADSDACGHRSTLRKVQRRRKDD